MCLCFGSRRAKRARQLDLAREDVVALVKCAECGREISDSAVACPQCGAPGAANNRSAPAPAAVSAPAKPVPQRPPAQQQAAATTRKVSIPLGIGIALCPPIFSWFTLRNGYSSVARIVAFGWFAFVVFSASRNSHQHQVSAQASPPATTTSAPTPQPAAPRPAPSETAMRVNAIALWQQYDANEVAADNQFKDRLLLVQGTVDAVDKDFLDRAIIRLKSPNPFMTTLATLKESSKGAAASARKGQAIALLCRGAGRILGAPTLSDCELR